jgi:hypothetical protein
MRLGTTAYAVVDRVKNIKIVWIYEDLGLSDYTIDINQFLSSSAELPSLIPADRLHDLFSVQRDMIKDTYELISGT